MAKAELEIVMRGKSPGAWERYDAVIEAARALIDASWVKYRGDDELELQLKDLRKAVEALKEVEGE